TAIGNAERLALALTVAGLVAGVLMIVTVGSPIAKVDVANGSCEVINDADPHIADRCELSGWERHGPGMVILGLGTLLMGYGVGLKGFGFWLEIVGGVLAIAAGLTGLTRSLRDPR